MFNSVEEQNMMEGGQRRRSARIASLPPRNYAEVTHINEEDRESCKRGQKRKQIHEDNQVMHQGDQNGSSQPPIAPSAGPRIPGQPSEPSTHHTGRSSSNTVVQSVGSLFRPNGGQNLNLYAPRPIIQALPAPARVIRPMVTRPLGFENRFGPGHGPSPVPLSQAMVGSGPSWRVDPPVMGPWVSAVANWASPLSPQITEQTVGNPEPFQMGWGNAVGQADALAGPQWAPTQPLNVVDQRPNLEPEIRPNCVEMGQWANWAQPEQQVTAPFSNGPDNNQMGQTAGPPLVNTGPAVPHMGQSSSSDPAQHLLPGPSSVSAQQEGRAVYDLDFVKARLEEHQAQLDRATGPGTSRAGPSKGTPQIPDLGLHL